MRVSVIGTGYVGLVSGVCLAEKGHEVVCVDLERGKVDRINAGDSPIFENGLESLLKKNLGSRFRATTDLADAVLNSELSLIAVGTPFDGDQIDLRFIKESARQIGEVLRSKNNYHVVVVKSTVVPGTTCDVVLPILEKSSGKKAGSDFGVGMNPEFLREGCAIGDFMSPDRIVLGALDERSGKVLADLYQPFPNTDKVRTSLRTAEVIKYAANSLLAMLISFSNEIGNLCSGLEDVDAIDVMKGVHLDKRLSPIMPDGRRIIPEIATYLMPGCGFGGSCFPKDLKALVSFGKQAGAPMELLEAVVNINKCQPHKMLGLLEKHFPVLNGIRVAVLGLAFKPGTDDVRESPAIPIVSELIARHATVTVFDPIVQKGHFQVSGSERITFAKSLSEAVRDKQAILLLTRWPEFAGLPGLIAGFDSPPVVIDGRRLFGRTEVVRYEGIGLGRQNQAASPAV